MDELDRVVKIMLDDHLSVIIDIHPTTQFKAELFQGTAGVGNFVELWRALAHTSPPSIPSTSSSKS